MPGTGVNICCGASRRGALFESCKIEKGKPTSWRYLSTCAPAFLGPAEASLCLFTSHRTFYTHRMNSHLTREYAPPLITTQHYSTTKCNILAWYIPRTPVLITVPITHPGYTLFSFSRRKRGHEREIFLSILPTGIPEARSPCKPFLLFWSTLFLERDGRLVSSDMVCTRTCRH